MLSLLSKLFPSKNEREVKRLQPMVDDISRLEAAMQALSDEALKAKTVEFRERLAKGHTLDDLLVEAFAVVREAGRRTLGLRHYDVQMIGGMVLNAGKIQQQQSLEMEGV